MSSSISLDILIIFICTTLVQTLTLLNHFCYLDFPPFDLGIWSCLLYV
jgi:hypothetical protein